MVREDIETVIDRLYDYILVNKNVRIKDAASALALPEEQVERLALLLEESNLIDLHYTLGGARLASKAVVLKPAEEVKKLPSSAAIEKKVQVLGEEVQDAENIAEFMEKDLLRRLKIAEATLKSLEGQKTLSRTQVEDLEREITSLLGKMRVFESSVKKVEVEGETFSTRLADFRGRLERLEKIHVEKNVFQRFLEILALYIVLLQGMLGLKLRSGKAKPGETAGEVKEIASQPQEQETQRLPEAEKARGGAAKPPAGKARGGKQKAREKPEKREDNWRRILKQREDMIRQHYWKKGKSEKRAVAPGKKRK